MSVGKADVDMADPSIVAGAGTASLHTVVAGTCVSSTDVVMGNPSIVASAGMASSCTVVVTGTCISSVYTSVGTGSTMCKSELEVGGCAAIVVTSGHPVGVPVRSSMPSSVSSSLKLCQC